MDWTVAPPLAWQAPCWAKQAPSALWNRLLACQLLSSALQGHAKGVTCVEWSRTYKFIASGSLDRLVMLWNPFSQQPLATLQVACMHRLSHFLPTQALL